MNAIIVLLIIVHYLLTNKKQTHIMGELDELKNKVAEVNAKADALTTGLGSLKFAVDAEQQQVAESIDDLKAQIAALSNGADVAEVTQQLQAISDKLSAASASLAETTADVASTIADAQVDENQAPEGDTAEGDGNTGS